ncbi:aldo/keto reductase [Barnesiella sp. An55]|uniref:aldo/keto reductase n=1 Tax=Barnesiella sp. An55 TaxID=1965646 RepID=UPI000B3938C2|nr:aldo/keto reductase [Barnesiella sp. An55]OUN69010.1 aldo/keto reductase [Barnesiella sp. An55]HIZ26817.1 aldo/keto reductase [Candidatus Barnesiella merdipullorum]
MENKPNKNINRRNFLKVLGGTAIASAAVLPGCKNRQEAAHTATTEVPTDQMTYRTNPKTQDRVSLLGYGMMRLPNIPSPDGTSSTIDQEAVNELVDYAIAHGVNYFDTSPVYMQGGSEKATGIALKRYPRDKYFVATKLSNFSNYTRENSITMYRKSFENLQVDTIDYYLLHSIGNGGIETFRARYIENGMLDYLIEERKAGRIRNLGFSFHGTKEVFDEVLGMHEKVHWDFVQIQLNYVDWRHASGNNVNAEYLYAELEKRHIPAVIMEPLLGGRLSNVPDHIAATLKQQAPESSVASWAFRFAGSHPDVLTVLSGMTYMEHLQDNLRTYSPLDTLTNADLDFLEETAQLMLRYPTIPCNDCKYCMPCPYGIDIPAILLHYNKCINEGNVPASSQDENYRKARRAFLVGYDRSVPKLRQASHCIGCHQCVPHCPQSIDIPKELHRIDRFVEDLKQGKEF